MQCLVCDLLTSYATWQKLKDWPVYRASTSKAVRDLFSSEDFGGSPVARAADGGTPRLSSKALRPLKSILKASAVPFVPMSAPRVSDPAREDLGKAFCDN